MKVIHAKFHPELEDQEIDNDNFEALSFEILSKKLEDNPPPWLEFEGQETRLGQIHFDLNRKLLDWIHQLAYVGTKDIDKFRGNGSTKEYLNKYFAQFGPIRNAWLRLFDSVHGPFASNYKSFTMYGNYCWPP